MILLIIFIYLQFLISIKECFPFPFSNNFMLL